MKATFPLLLILLAGCFGRGGPYEDLQASFPATGQLSSAPIPSRTMVLVSRHHRGAYNYQNNTEIRLSEHEIEFTPKLPWLKSVRIPANAISACTESSFGGDNWDADLLVGSLETEISVHASAEVVDWCWSNRIVPASSEEKRQWLYNGRPLPPRDAYREYLSSREAYNERLGKARIGY